MSGTDDLLRLITKIYEAAETPDKWTECLDAFRQVFETRTASFIYRSHEQGTGAVVAASGVDETMLRRYAEYSHIDPYAPPEITTVRSGDVVVDEQWVRRADMVKTQFYAEFGKASGVSRALFAFPENSARGTAPLVMNRGDNDPAFTARDAERLRVLVPHLQQALRIHRRLTEVAADRSAAYEAIDQMVLGVIILDGSLNPVFVNRAAAAIDRERDGLVVESDGLRAATAGLTGQLRRLLGTVARTLETGEAPACGGQLLLARPSGRRPYEVQVAPVGPGRAEPFGGRGRVVVFVNDPERIQRPADHLLRQLYGLTPTEVQVASSLAEGLTVPEIAGQFAVTLNTVRWHLKRILSKTGTSTQAQLVRLVLATMALMGS